MHSRKAHTGPRVSPLSVPNCKDDATGSNDVRTVSAAGRLARWRTTITERERRR
jgi:hypothetical protein